MKKRIYIVGGNGFARECYCYLQDINELNSEVEFAGFLGHGGYGHTVDYLDLQTYYMGEVAEHKFLKNEYAVIGAGYPKLREKIYNDLKKLNINFYTLVSKNAVVNENIQLGEGNIFINTKIQTHNVKISNGNLFNGEVVIGHDAEVGDFNFFGPRSQLLGGVKVGNSNIIGANAILLPAAKIGDNNKISPLSTIYKGCKNNCYMHGNPAIKIGSAE